MPRAIAAIASDVHMAPRAFPRRDIEGDAYVSWEQIVRGTIERGVDTLILAGDSTDGWSTGPSAPAAMLAGLSSLDAAGVRVLFIVGQHDQGQRVYGTRFWPELGPNATHVSGRCVDVGGVSAFFLDYQPHGRLQEALAAVPSTADFGVFHQVWEELGGAIMNPQGKLAEIPHLMRALTGDYHVCKTVRVVGASGQDLEVDSLGSTCMQSSDEPPEKFYGILYDDLSLEPVRLATRPRLDWPDVETEEELEALIARVPALFDARGDGDASLPDVIRTPIVRVAYRHSVPDAARRLSRAVGGRGHLFMKEIPPPAEAAARRVAGDRALTLDGCLELVVDKVRDPELMTLARRALSAPEGGVEAELDGWLRAYLAPISPGDDDGRRMSD